tara:strand:+ start:993 stop:1142 length:150 start_codon:yes stop_codon:yes gene_type:complete
MIKKDIIALSDLADMLDPKAYFILSENSDNLTDEKFKAELIKIIKNAGK